MPPCPARLYVLSFLQLVVFFPEVSLLSLVLLWLFLSFWISYIVKFEACYVVQDKLDLLILCLHLPNVRIKHTYPTHIVHTSPFSAGVEPRVSPTSLSYTPNLIDSEALVMLLMNFSSSYLSLWSMGLQVCPTVSGFLVPVMIFHSLSGPFLVPTRCSSYEWISHFLSATALGLPLKWAYNLSPLLTAQQVNLQGSCCISSLETSFIIKI